VVSVSQFQGGVRFYETLSETDAGLGPLRGLQLTVPVDISAHLERKIELMRAYTLENGAFPVTRNEEALRMFPCVMGYGQSERPRDTVNHCSLCITPVSILGV
jgi:hypothetical protein